MVMHAPNVDASISLSWLGSSGCVDDALKGVVVILAASATRSEHPLSRGIEEGMSQLVGSDLLDLLLAAAPDMDGFESVTGHGVRFKLGDMNADVGSTTWDSAAHENSASISAKELVPELSCWTDVERGKASTV